MPEVTLSVDLFKLRAEVGDVAGYGRKAREDQDEWDSVQTDQINAAVELGLQWVYYTEELVDSLGRTIIPAAYDWSWLKPVATLTLPSGKNQIDLPADFGGLCGNVIPISGTHARCPIPIVGDYQFYAKRDAAPDSTGCPTMVLIEPVKGTAPGHGTRYRLLTDLIADGNYTLKVWYYFHPNALTEALPHVYGGPAHSATFKSAVRAAYEYLYLGKYRDGPEQAKFLDRLKTSIAYDRKLKPRSIGPNVDSSDEIYSGRSTGTIHFDYAGITPG